MFASLLRKHSLWRVFLCFDLSVLNSGKLVEYNCQRKRKTNKWRIFFEKQHKLCKPGHRGPDCVGTIRGSRMSICIKSHQGQVRLVYGHCGGWYYIQILDYQSKDSLFVTFPCEVYERNSTFLLIELLTNRREKMIICFTFLCSNCWLPEIELY